MKRIVIDQATALDLLRQVVAEHGADTVYQGATEYYVYAEYGVPSCLVGHALHHAGVPVSELERLGDGEIAEVRLPDCLHLTEQARLVFSAAETAQDSTCTWGEALRADENQVTDSRTTPSAATSPPARISAVADLGRAVVRRAARPSTNHEGEARPMAAKSIPTPAYIAGTERHPTLGYPIKNGCYLASYYLTRLRRAISNGGVYAPDFNNELDLAAVQELQENGLFDDDYTITAAGRWHLADRGVSG